MDRNRKTKQSVIVAGCAVAFGALLIPSASAAPDDPGLFVLAQDVEQPTIQAMAGDEGRAGSGEIVAPAADSIATTLNCGPASYSLMKSMVDLSEANFALGGGSSPKTHSSGAQSVYSLSSQSYSMLPGIERGGYLEVVALRSTMDRPDYYSTWMNPGAGNRVVEVQSSNFCKLYDGTVAPAVGSSFYYEIDRGASYSEGRYVDESFGLTPTVVKFSDPELSGPVRRDLTRYEDGTMQKRLQSSTVLSSLYSFSDGSGRGGTLYLPEHRDGYNQIDFYSGSDGSQLITFSDSTTGGSLNKKQPDRKHGPIGMSVLKDGRFSALSYIDSRGQQKTLSIVNGDTVTVAEYNRVTGQDWDGSHPDLNDYDYRIPFEPKAP